VGFSKRKTAIHHDPTPPPAGKLQRALRFNLPRGRSRAMGRKKKDAPDLYWYSGRKQWAVNLGRNRRLLGPDRLAAERRRLDLLERWRDDGEVPAAVRSTVPARSATVAEVLDAYQADARGRVSAGQFDRIGAATETAARLYGATPAAQFGTLALRTVREEFARQRSRRPPHGPLSRNYVNSLTGCLQTAWLWAESRQLVPPHHGITLRSVRALREGEGGRETDPRQPVAAEVVAATLPHCGRVLGAMIRFQQSTGCRPQDVCRLTPGRVSRSPSEILYPMPRLAVSAFADESTGRLLWVYCPERHKGRKLGRPRIIVVGPEAQTVLAPFLDRPSSAHCFTPAQQAADRRAELRAGRRTPVPPSQVGRGERRAAVPGRRAPGSAWTTATYGQSLKRAVRRANRQRAADGLPALPEWVPHQLRHGAATAALNRADDHTAAAVIGDHPDLLRTYARQAMLKAGAYLAEHG
jgi:integrase